MVVLFTQRLGQRAWCERTLIQGKGESRGPTWGGSPVPCPGITPGSRICPLPRPHGLLGKERVLRRPDPPASPGIEQLEDGLPVRADGRGHGLDGRGEKALPFTS